MVTSQYFRKIIYAHYRKRGRSFPWRKTKNPYRILVSEIMLQQTQVSRVVEKYQHFIKVFPSFHSLARAPLKKILRVWQGLGYNRRALALKRIAEQVVKEYRGKLPLIPEILETLPGIGHYTARAIVTFASNQPMTLIETNIRTVYIHFFFHTRKRVGDREILPLIEQTLDRKNPRVWYWALMDYGAMLKGRGKSNNSRSRHYHRQSAFKGSNRELRGKILKALLEKERDGIELSRLLKKNQNIVLKSVAQLTREGLLRKERSKIKII